MKGRLINFVTALSLLLGVAVVALWVRSHFWVDAAGCRDLGRGYFHASSDRGGVLFTHIGEYRGESTVLLGHRATAVTERRDHRAGRPIGHYWHGFQFFHLPNRTNSTLVGFSGVAVPHWFLAALCLFLPLYRFASRLVKNRRGRRRSSAGLCPGCGYDLRGTPGGCPECGRFGAVSVPG